LLLGTVKSANMPTLNPAGMKTNIFQNVAAQYFFRFITRIPPANEVCASKTRLGDRTRNQPTRMAWNRWTKSDDHSFLRRAASMKDKLRDSLRIIVFFWVD
jgi:hypothetical protein